MENKNINKFVHLHLHTEYSLLDGAIRILDINRKPAHLFSTAKKYGMNAIAITDHGNMYGVIEFYETCMNEGIKPIIGAEIYVAPNKRFDKDPNYFHLTLLAENEEGYKNLMKIVSIAYLEGFYYKPKADKEILMKYSKGIIALSGCISGEIPQSILKNKKTDEIIESYLNIFGKENFYFEIQDNGVPEQKIVNEKLKVYSKKYDVGLVATNDAHYLNKEDAYIQEILLCIGTGKTLNDTKRMKFATDEFYFKSPEEMIKIFSDVPEAIENTVKIASRCNVKIDFAKIYLPVYKVPDGFDENTYLRHLCEQNLPNRYTNITDVIKERLEHELKIITQMGFSSYFLIVYDFIKYANENGISVGPGRGSGTGSIVAYILKITDVDPLNYGLIFERFLNPSRITMPDLDIDFADTGREKVINYVKEKYGEKNVAQIITFGSMQARLAIRDVGRVLDIKLMEIDKISKLIPAGSTIYDAMNNIEEFKKLVNSKDEFKKLVSISQKIEGIKRHIGIHAAGLLISKDDMTNYVPFTKSAKKVIATQYEGEYLVKLGLLKMDFLGLKNLSIIDDTIELIKKYRNINIDIGNIPLYDKKTYNLLNEGKAIGVFQMESSGMRELLKKIKIENIEDIIALIALYRPGPMGSGMLEDFVNRKNGKSKIKYAHPSLEAILKDTYGVILYQEQVMNIAVEMAGFSAVQADNLRKAMGKKNQEIIKKEKNNFIQGAIEKGVKKEVAGKVFNDIEKFGGYGFNKSHSTAYGILSYRTAYLKANYPIEYMTAILNNAIGDSAAIIKYIDECSDMDIEILRPDIQKSYKNFSIEDLEHKKIRIGFSVVKSVGEGASQAIVKARDEKDFKSLTDMIRRVDPNNINKKVIENLAKAGAFDSLKYKRSSLFEGFEFIMTNVNRTNKDSKKGQFSFFEQIEGFSKESKEKLPDIPEWSESILLSYEKDALGFYITGHPLVNLQKDIQLFSKFSIQDIYDKKISNEVKIVGFISNLKKMKTKKGDIMCFLTLEDLKGQIEVLVFPKIYAKYETSFDKDDIVFIKGKIDSKDEKITIIADEIMQFSEAKKNYVKEIIVTTNIALTSIEKFQELKKILDNDMQRGYTGVILNIKSIRHGYIKIDTKRKIILTPEIEENLTKIFDDSISYKC
ncbi:MAG: DNA polymerase III subunit alpha [Elusimicrobiota bacterium]|jgi:DNA polymerase-3 subunit alpha|nr:DNA polymerase III subunit alpha [Elusimicrobiota bacterium]